MRNQDILFVSETSKVSRVRDIPPPPEKENDTEDKDKMISLADASNAILFKATTVFPFTFFPNSIIIAKREGVHIEELSKDEIMKYGEVIGKGDREE